MNETDPQRQDPSDDERISCFGWGCIVVALGTFVVVYLYIMSWVNWLIDRWFG